jgi:hypothetical protein
MSTVAYITRNASGTNQHGTSAEGSPSVIPTNGATDISLNLDPSDVQSYARRGRDLHITLFDGTVVELEGFYDPVATGSKNLFLSDGGDFIEVVLEDKADGMLFASYEPIDISGKWSAYDDMVFLDVDRIEPVVAPLAAPLLGGLGGLGAAAAGAAVLVGGGGGGGGGDGDGAIVPTVDDADGTYDVPEGDPDGVTITGTGEAGSTVEVDIGGVTGTTTVGEDGTWSVDFPTSDLPGDGVYETVVDVVAPDGTTYDDLDGPTIDIDTEAPTVIVTEGTKSVNDIVNGDEQESGTIISGTGEAGATVTLVIEGHSQTTTVDENGNWTVTFSSDEIDTGEYETDIEITTTDPHGNSTVSSDVLVVDTETTVAIDTGLAGGDDLINAAEAAAAAGVAITGTAEAGAAVEVVVEGVTRTTTADSNGTWSVIYEAGTLPSGTYDADISVTSTDTAGNSATADSTIAVDTEAGFVQLSDDPIETDDVINEDERADGVTITGTATPGETVTVQLGTAQGTVVADSNGDWSYDFAASEIPEGTGDLDISATIQDSAGNTASDTDTVAYDTEVTNYTSADQNDTVGVNLQQMQQGFTLQGTVEEGSSVSVEINGTTHDAVVDSSGNWSLTVDGDDIGSFSQGGLVATVTATDPAGNVDTLTQPIDIDTLYETPEFAGTTTIAGQIQSIFLDESDDALTMYSLDSSGNATQLDATETSSGISGVDKLDLDTPISDGANLIVQSTDDAGNKSSTLVIDQENPSSSLLSGLDGFNIDAIDLVFEDGTDGANLVLTEALIKEMSDNSDTLTIRADELANVTHEVTLTGATEITSTVSGYSAYSIGDATVLIEEDAGISLNGTPVI